ncbi:acyltransferase [uncultured Desulfuromusa sp.]|uniref:acyltransferase n=1 Tax=uncultured Desulfuromusa sp. TaxID=219183 RepID=UPI002AA6563D|nr:acyltransferase [uncultured Desulfuromusa sp.]
MLTKIRRVWWEINKPLFWYDFLYYFIESIPGLAGQKIRGGLVSKYSARCDGGKLIIHRRATLQGIHSLTLGENVQIGQDVFIQANGKVTLEDDVMIGPGTKIWSVNHKFEDINVPIYDQGYTQEAVTIKKGVWIGANSFVMPGVTLPEGCVVCACTVVNKKKYKPYSILSGNPCRMIGTRSPQGEKQLDYTKD